MNTNKKQQTKTFAVITYFLALVCLLLGLFLPMFEGEMLALSLVDIVTDIIGGTFETVPMLIAIYAVVTALGVIALIPIFASKKVNKTAAGWAYFIELLAILAVGALLVILIASGATLEVLIKDYLALVIAFAGVAVAYLLQSLKHKKGSGVMKIFMFALSACAVMCLVGLPLVGEPLANLLSVDEAFIDGFMGEALITEFIVSEYSITFLGSEITEIIMAICALVAVGLTLVNALIDLIGISTGTSKGCKVLNTIRYILVTVAAGAVIILAQFVVKVDWGVYVALLGAITLVQFIISLIRAIAHKKQPAYAVEEVEVEEEFETVDYSAPVEPAQPAPVEPVYATSFDEPYVEEPAVAAPAVEAVPVASTQPVAEETPNAQPVEPAKQYSSYVYSIANVYHGPTDDFINTLNEKEKIEFAQIFLEKKRGTFANVPEYEFGGNNRDFFSAIFIYLGKFRNMLSDSLLNKIYNQLH